MTFALLIALACFAVGTSKQPLKTILYALGVIASAFAFGMLLAVLIPSLDREVVGRALADVALLLGVLTAWVHSRKTKEKN
jgi:hypothetical protein